MRGLQLSCPHPTNFDYHSGYQQAQMDAEPHLLFAYLAGIFDGEGCVHESRSGTYYFTVANQDLQTCQLFCEHFGGSVHFDKRDKCFRWMATGKAAKRTTKALLPYLRIKKLKAVVAMHKNFGCKNPVITQEAKNG